MKVLLLLALPTTLAFLVSTTLAFLLPPIPFVQSPRCARLYSTPLSLPMPAIERHLDGPLISAEDLENLQSGLESHSTFDGDVDVSLDSPPLPTPAAPTSLRQKAGTAYGSLKYPKLTIVASSIAIGTVYTKSTNYYRSRYHKSEAERLEDFKRIMGMDTVESARAKPPPPQPSLLDDLKAGIVDVVASPEEEPLTPPVAAPSPAPPAKKIITLKKEIRTIDDLMSSSPEDRVSGRSPPPPPPTNDWDDDQPVAMSDRKRKEPSTEAARKLAVETTAPTYQPPTPLAAPPAPKSKLKKMFSRSTKPTRPTNLDAVLKESGFARQLATQLTFGARGRFPSLETTTTPSPLSELTSLRDAAGLTDVLAAETFAGVVNCMLIELIDLASSTLLEEEAITVKALDIVLEFTEHAGELYEAVAGGVVIEPVVYGGKLPKHKLESMYGVYVGKNAMNAESTKRTDRLQVSLRRREFRGLEARI